MAEVEKAKKTIAAEQKVVLEGLRQASEDRHEELDWHEECLSRITKRACRLLVRGKEAGVTVKDMAAALEVTRQEAHRLLREGEEAARMRPGEGFSKWGRNTPRGTPEDFWRVGYAEIDAAGLTAEHVLVESISVEEKGADGIKRLKPR